jgi:D-tagatose-1,6-bisphosphate aldolase subunit GatZ/KbaZ
MCQLLDEIVRAQKRGEARGMASICSAHPWVLKTSLRGEAPVLIESTCNQVNQYGGYTGMTPLDFVKLVRKVAAENGFPAEHVLLGGDHLGPSPWQADPHEQAMQRAAQMVRAYVQAGYSKIHLDASMKLGDDDPAHPLELELAAQRTAWLAKAAESVTTSGTAPRYIIGSEVPTPGGATCHEQGVRLTTVEDARRTLEVMEAAFTKAGLEAAWERVLALVVQPGVEFGDDFILDYQPTAAGDPARFSETMPIIYEAHSTDYQTRGNLQAMVRDHFAILKVGPALTCAFREAVFSLAMMENELLPVDQRSNLIDTLDEAMRREPIHWKNHYHGDERAVAFARKYSLSDRVRYYWTDPRVQAALKRLFANLNDPLPLSLISQFLPEMVARMRSGKIPSTAGQIVFERIRSVLDDYDFACGGGWKASLIAYR